MIADSHCHAWRSWPYNPAVPDPSSRGTVDQLLYEMDAHGVERAAVVCARLSETPDTTANDGNNEYVAAFARKHPDRIDVIADVDCSWRPEHHTPGAAARLRGIAERLQVTGFTHYVRPENDGWFVSEEGLEFFGVAAELDLVASVAVSPAWQSDLRVVARAFPTLPILVHHLGGVSTTSATFDADLAEVVASAAVPNILIKVSGFHYLSAQGWNYPYDDARVVFDRIIQAFGVRRLCWGSDFPAARPLLTYRQSLEIVRTLAGLHPDDLDPVLGNTLAKVLDTRRPPTAS